MTTDAPHNGGTHPPENALQPPPRRPTPARKGARCGAGAGSPRPQRPHPGHRGRGTPATRPRGRTAGGGTAPDTRRPSQRWQAIPPGDGPPPPPRHAAPTGHAGQRDSVGPPHPQTRAHSTWVADPNSPPSGRAVGGGGAPDLRRASQGWKAPPPGTPFRHPHSEQRRRPRAHAVEPVLGPHARTDRTRNTRVAVPRLPSPEDGRSGEGQRLTPDAPHNGGKAPPPGDGPPPPPRHAAPTGHTGQGDSVGPPHRHARAHGTWVVDPNSPPNSRAVGGGGAPDLTRPSQRWKAPPPGDAPPPPPPRATPARKGARCRAGAGSPRPHQPHPGHTGRGTPAARPRGRAAAGGTAPDTRRPSQRWQATLPGTALHHPRGRGATGPSSRNAQTAWNGVPASEGKGHPDRTARHTHRGTRGAGRGKRERHNTRYRPEPAEPGASAAHTRTGHCTRQGSSGALSQAPIPSQGSLRSGPRGSHWRQASSTGPAAPAPRATTH